eukprot:9463830-Pyramimonas_sp.AAC.1
MVAKACGSGRSAALPFTGSIESAGIFFTSEKSSSCARIFCVCHSLKAFLVPLAINLDKRRRSAMSEHCRRWRRSS